MRSIDRHDARIAQLRADRAGIDPTPDDRPPVDRPVSPWARGGVMSYDWITPRRPVVGGAFDAGTARSHGVPAGRGDPRLRVAPRSAFDASAARSRGVPAGRLGPRRLAIVGVGVAAIAVVVIQQWATGPVETREALDSASTSTPVRVMAVGPMLGSSADFLPREPVRSPDLAAPSMERVENPSTESIVGTITWQRIDGDASLLPARVLDRDSDALFGSDDDGGRWRSNDGTGWTRSEGGRRSVGGVDWRVSEEDGRTTLVRIVDGGAVDVDVDVVDAVVVDGFRLSVEPDMPSSGGFPVEIDGQAHLLATVRAELPWTDVLGLEPDEPFRIRVDTAHESIGAVSGDFHEMAVTPFDLREVDKGGAGDRVLIDDARGATVWSFALGANDLEFTTADVVAGRSSSVWSRWDGDRFVRIETPWGPRDRVEVAVVPEGLLARSVAPVDRTATVWSSADGRRWVKSRLPAAPLDGTPVDLRQGDDEAIVTAFSADGRVSWTTTAGSEFDELADVAGVEARTRGSFGWIAPSPRGAPQLHVSPDGKQWELIDIAPLLGLDGSRWDTEITARAHRSKIVVVVDRPDGRMLLIGDVQRDVQRGVEATGS